MKNGFIKAQAQFRMLREKKRFSQLKEEFKELKDAQTQNSPSLERKNVKTSLSLFSFLFFFLN